jgi:hypothetical protein
MRRGYFARVLQMATPGPPAPAAPRAPSPAAPGADAFDPVAMGLEQESFVERRADASSTPAQERPVTATPARTPAGSRSASPATVMPGARPPTGAPTAPAAAAFVTPSAEPARATASPAPRPPGVPVELAPIEQDVLVEATAAPMTSPVAAAAAVPARAPDLLGQVRRWIATPPPARPAAPKASPLADEAGDLPSERELFAATPSPATPEPRARAASSASPAPGPGRVPARPSQPDPIEVHIGSIQVTMEDPAPATAPRAAAPERRSGGTRAGFGRGWLQRRRVRV